MKSRVVSFVAALALSGCAGSASPSSGTTPASRTSASSSSTPVLSERPVTGDRCVANYFAERDVTIIAIEVPNVGIVGAPALGDGWQVDCRPHGNQLLMASNESTNRYVSIVVDAGISGMPDLQSYAAEHAAMSGAGMEANGLTDVRVSEPILVDANTYVIGTQGSARGTNIAQLNVYGVRPSPIGLLRYHASELAEDGRTLSAHADAMVVAARVFNTAPAEALEGAH